MEGEKERQMQQREEKESNEAEDDRRSDDDADNEEEEDEGSDGAALVWQEGYSEDSLGLPIMHWEALSLRIAELEKQEEEKKEKKEKRGTVQVHKNPQPPAKPEKSKSRGFRNTLRNLRDRLRTDHKTLPAACSPPVVQRRHLERSDLQNFSIKDLKALSTSLSQAIQDLSSELVGRLQVRDQLRTEQDAMLLEVQDLTSL
ncbi:Schwannomin-interacting protein 1 [Nibea albiflora]|uniref:Schwannomin-interacting protein 1 n=1 Tax=Nibea albiflora TaxID=240163 RepID=A0ACB7EVW1_NIBAL|nr:Schwannomin-interacting protein 1 [Nibea albiflora]